MSDARPIVVHVITMLELGGAQQNTLDTCRLLDRGKFAVALLAGEGGLLDSEAARIPELDFRIVPDLVREVAPRRDLRALGALEAHLRELARGRERTIVHTHSSKAGILGRIAARRAGLRDVVHTVHGFGHPAFANRLLRRAALWAERRAARHTRRIVCVSRANEDEGRRLRLFGDAEVAVIRSAFDVAAFANPGVDHAAARRRLGLDPAAPVVGAVACLKPQKAPEDFVRAAAKVHAARPDTRFVLAGDGELRADVERVRDALGLRDALTLLGWRDDVEKVLPAFDVFLLTSRWEGLPRAVVQAMAAGVPVVATAVDGVTDVVRDGVTGFAVPAGDVDALAERVLTLLGDDALRARFAKEARAIADGFDVRRMIAELERLYEGM